MIRLAAKGRVVTALGAGLNETKARDYIQDMLKLQRDLFSVKSKDKKVSQNMDYVLFQSMAGSGLQKKR